MTEAVQERDILKVLDGIELTGNINTPEDDLVAHVRHSITLGYPQVKAQPPQADRVCLVGGGPSLDATFSELRDLYFAGAKVVTVNGSYQWCLDRNIRPSAQVVLDARKENARFVDPVVPNCKYMIASQCHPDTWAKVAGRPDVFIWHAVTPANTTSKPVLDEYYLRKWQPSPGGTTVIMRAISLFNLLGFMRFDLFGVDSCFMDGKHHAYAQPENAGDTAHPFTVFPTGHPELSRTFQCAPWHAKQLEDLLQCIRMFGHGFALNIHGDGLLAYALQCSAQVEWSGAAATDGDCSGKE
jgi:hypothetical protein